MLIAPAKKGILFRVELPIDQKSSLDELLEKHRLSDENWDNLRKYYNEDQMMEFMVLVGYYIMIAITINSAGVELESFSWLK